MSICDEFSDRPFIAGTIVGIRSFAVTNEGVLTGVTHRLPWEPGLNNAVCDGGQQTYRFGVFHPEVQQHHVAQVDCSCGFYAYFDAGYNEFHSDHNVLGVIEAYGTVTVGDRGCRASKARIVGLVRNQQPAHITEMPPGCGCLHCQALGIPVRVEWELIAARYDVPVYDTVEEALAATPLTPVENPNPKPPANTAWTVSPAVAQQGWQSYIDAMKQQMQTLTLQLNQTSQAFKTYTFAFDDPEPIPTGDESPRERALRLKRERNTGPAGPRLDGRRA